MTTKDLLQLRVLPLAGQAIVDQSNYYELRQDLRLAQRWEASVAEAILSLRTLPERGSLCRFSSPSLGGLRRLPIQGFRKHLLFYKIIEASNSLVIVSVIHGARDIEPLLAQSLP